VAPRGRQPRAGSEVHTCARPQAWLNQRQLGDKGISGFRVSQVRLPVENKQRHMTTSAGRNHGVGVGDLIVRRRPAQQTSQPVPPVQSELSRQWFGTHHLDPAPIAFATHVWMKLSLAGSASILCAASAQAICAWTSHCFTKLKRAAPASLCSMAIALQVWSAAAVLLITKPQSTNIRARGCIRSGRGNLWSG